MLFRGELLGVVAHVLELLSRRNSLGEVPKAGATKLFEESRFPLSELARWNLSNLGERDEALVNLRIELILRQIAVVGKDAELFRRNRIGAGIASFADDVPFAVGDGPRVSLEVRVDEAVRGLADVLAVGVAADADDRVDPVAGAVQAVEPLQPVDDPLVGVHRKDARPCRC